MQDLPTHRDHRAQHLLWDDWRGIHSMLIGATTRKQPSIIPGMKTTFGGRKYHPERVLPFTALVERFPSLIPVPAVAHEKTETTSTIRSTGTRTIPRMALACTMTMKTMTTVSLPVWSGIVRDERRYRRQTRISPNSKAFPCFRKWHTLLRMDIISKEALLDSQNLNHICKPCPFLF